jgi:alkanesulfonate monooxygenase SsuD/methylene tetrahydromethanopterin reductase-like flavin-dependent oxidoreductase (luciferase family)
MARIRFGVRIPVTGPVSSREHLVEAPVEAERLGFDAVFIGDHVAPGGADAFERHKVSPPGAGTSSSFTAPTTPCSRRCGSSRTR